MTEDFYQIIKSARDKSDAASINSLVLVLENALTVRLGRSAKFLFSGAEAQDLNHLHIEWSRREFRIKLREPNHLVFERLVGILELIWPSIYEIGEAYLEVHVGDFAPSEFTGLAFASSNPLALLIPDAYFMMFRGYEGNLAKLDQIIEALPRNAQPIQQAYWRGALTGLMTTDAFGKLTNQRIELARTSNNHPAVNAKITGRAEYEHDFYQSLELEGLTEKYAPFEHCLVYQLQIDVDGYGPAWSGLFNKLYTGRPVVKVLSLHGFRQWYYFSLIDKYNLYYVKPDMSDLASTVDLLLSNDQDNLNVIGQRARDIVKSLQYARVVRSKQAEICDWIEGKQSMAN